LLNKIKTIMYRIEAIAEREFDTLKEMNEWIEENEYDIKIISIQRELDSYVMFFGVVLNP